jgi:hypothetical protein
MVGYGAARLTHPTLLEALNPPSTEFEFFGF